MYTGCRRQPWNKDTAGIKAGGERWGGHASAWPPGQPHRKRRLLFPTEPRSAPCRSWGRGRVLKGPTKGEGRLAVSQGVEPWGGVVCGFNLVVDLGGARIRPPPRVSAPSAGAVQCSLWPAARPVLPSSALQPQPGVPRPQCTLTLSQSDRRQKQPSPRIWPSEG